MFVYGEDLDTGVYTLKPHYTPHLLDILGQM